MANLQTFASSRGPIADTVNRAGGKAFALTPKQALAQYAVTGFFGQTYYASGQEQLKEALELAGKCDPEYIAKVALYARKVGMKDMPAFLCAHLTTRGVEGRAALSAAWKAIDNARMLRNFVQIIRSGQLGRRSLGTFPRRLVREWLLSRRPDQLFYQSVGDKPSLADVIKMVHPKPPNDEYRAIFAYLLGKKEVGLESPKRKKTLLPKLVKDFESWKKGGEGLPPPVPFQMLTGLPLNTENWTEIARNAKWMMTRMNLNTFKRHGVFEDKEMVSLVAERLRNEELIRKARQFPYQMLMAFKHADAPHEITEALQDALEISVSNVPKIEGDIVICPDVSGSMRWGGTGGRQSKVRYLDIAALFAAALLKTNPRAKMLPFSDRLYLERPGTGVNPRDSLASITRRIEELGGGGTDCSLPLRYLNKYRERADAVIYISDTESWLDDRRYYGNSTGTMVEFIALKKQCPDMKMVCIDLEPNRSTQAPPDKDILNVGGFSDSVFDVVKTFLEENDPDQWVKMIEHGEC
jgi:60 kDa SS-A/Ro ribonucleoprotein